MIEWKQWKNPKTRVRKLKSLGAPEQKAYEWGNSRKKFWRIASSPILHKTLENSYWSNRGLKSLGVPDQKAYEWGNSRKKYWRIASSPILHKTLDNSYWSNRGLKSLYQRYEFLRHT